MPKSKFKDHRTKQNKTFDKDKSVVTMLNSGDADSGHAMLFIEGQAPSGELDLFLCDILACGFSDYLKGIMSPLGRPTRQPVDSPRFEALKVAHGPVLASVADQNICYVRMNPHADYPELDRPYESYTATSWEVSTEHVAEMLRAIEREKEGIAANTRRAIQAIQKDQVPKLAELFPLFKLYGNQSTLISGSGVNCVNWCEAQLRVAGIQPVVNVSDSLAARPEDHARQHRCGPVS